MSDDEERVPVRKLMRSLGVVALLLVAGLGTAAPAAADPVADHRAFVQAGFDGTTDEEYRAWAEALAATPDGPAMRASATRALAGTVEDLRAYVDGGYVAAWQADEQVRLARVLATATRPVVYRSVQRVLDSPDPQVWSDFLTTGLPQAQYADDRLAAARMLAGGSDNSGPALDDAANAALDGTPAELREFILTGQFVARALDAQAAPPVVPGAPAVPAVPAAPAAPVAPAAPAAPVAAAPVAAAPQGAAPSAAGQRPTVLAVTGVAEGPTVALAVTSLLTGTGLVVLARRRRRA